MHVDAGLDVMERYVDVTDRYNVLVSGRPDGQPMMFAHGFGCDQHMWRRVAPRFEDEFRVVLFDHVGAGGSISRPTTPTAMTRSVGMRTMSLSFVVSLTWLT